MIDDLLDASGVAEPNRIALANVFQGLIEAEREAARGIPIAYDTQLCALRAAQAELSGWPAPPTQAPERYCDRPIDPATGRLEGPEKFIARAYAPWIIDDVLILGRPGLRRLDEECEAAVALWFTHNDRKGKSLFGMTSRSRNSSPPSPEQIREAQRVLGWMRNRNHGSIIRQR